MQVISGLGIRGSGYNRNRPGGIITAYRIYRYRTGIPAVYIVIDR